MDEERFWSIVEASRRRAAERERSPVQDFLDVHEETLAEELHRLSPDDVADFDRRFWELHARAYRTDLWAAAYWLHGGCGDDGFIDFRSCLISLGREPYERILENPDNLVDVVDRPDAPYMQSEGFQYVAGRVYRELTGQNLPDREGPAQPPQPVGEDFDFEDEDEMARRFPRLVERFPDMGD